ncbi:MAG: hypothetical protein ACRBFS_21610 [Aureispira sp.]
MYEYDFSSQFGQDLLYVKKPEQEDPVAKEEDKAASANSGKNKKADIAGIISASALGINSVTNAISMFTGKPTTPEEDQVTYQQREEEAAQKKAPNVLLILGVFGGVLVLIGLLAYVKKNKQAAPIPAPTT